MTLQKTRFDPTRALSQVDCCVKIKKAFYRARISLNYDCQVDAPDATLLPGGDAVPWPRSNATKTQTNKRGSYLNQFSFLRS